ncbi:glycosyltransferase 87 family protein [Yinghuangia sp. ASG 101]|uniref:glycosyltransferase 87 family protein n=1 Tax=Yinghuangia sp. ASG 101 TaxID=2896848 RepID=UPI001E5BFEEF|nr:glycosyltransferase 87 family protein [Yinghuangia sp. ASG 101]UGQ09382.1 glycosyltransferase 87 family protein [Yinghuangia sp. ASG 101]
MGHTKRANGRSLATRLRAPVPAVVAGLAASVAVYLGVRALIHPSMVDLVVYRAEGAAVAAGVDLYGPLAAPHDLRATYPPFAAMLFTALIVPPYEVLRDVAIAANIALLFVAALLSCRLVGVDGRRRTTVAVAVTALGIWAEPVFTTFRYGQINMLLLVLILADFTRPPTARTRGLALGIAVGIKVTPGIFVLYLLLTRRFREAAVAVAAFLATVGVGFAALPDASRRFWTDLVMDPTRVGRLENAANQTVRGMAVRITHTRDTGTVWFVLIAVVAVAGMACAVFAYRRLGDRWGLPVCAVTGLLVAPIAWTHHWVWCIPIAVLLWVDARPALSAVAVFWTFAVWYVPHVPFVELHFAPWQTALSGWYVLFGLGFLVFAARQAWHAAPPESRLGPRPRREPMAAAGSGPTVGGASAG